MTTHECFCGDYIWQNEAGNWRNACGDLLCYPEDDGPDGLAFHEPYSELSERNN